MSKKGEEKERLRRMKTMELARKKATKRPSPAAKTVEKVGLIKRATNFLKDVRRELKKVTWPPRQETISSTWVVLMVVFIFGFYFSVVDTIVGFLVRKLLTLGIN